MLAESQVVMISPALLMKNGSVAVRGALKGSGIKINHKEPLAEITFDSRREPRRGAPQHLTRGDDGGRQSERGGWTGMKDAES